MHPVALTVKVSQIDGFVEPLGARWKEGALTSFVLSPCSLMDFPLYSPSRVQDCVVQRTFWGHSCVGFSLASSSDEFPIFVQLIS